MKKKPVIQKVVHRVHSNVQQSKEAEINCMQVGCELHTKINEDAHRSYSVDARHVDNRAFRLDEVWHGQRCQMVHRPAVCIIKLVI